MKLKNFPKPFLFTVLLIIIATAAVFRIFFIKNREIPKTKVITVKPVASELLAQGTIKSENEATLHFQTGGKVVYLPFKEGDRVSKGQVVAKLDTYALQKQLTASLNNYRITRDTFDQTQDNATSGVLKGAQKYSLQTLNKGGFDFDSVIGDIIKRILDQNQATLDNSVINVELANYALQLSSIISPINGIVYHQDVNVPYVNITPVTSFIIVDPNSLIFRANISENDIDFVDIGSPATVQLDALKGKTFSGTVTKIYPGKITLPNGQHVYQVDIQSDNFPNLAKYDLAGTAIIKSNVGQKVTLIPSWLVLSNQFIWVVNNDKPFLREIKTGKTHGSNVEIISGLKSKDKVILNPESVISKKYLLL